MIVRRRLVGAVLAGLGAMGLVASEIVPAAAVADPMYGAPTVGTCRNYTYDALPNESETSAAVDCGLKHTAKIITVFQLPSGVDWSASMAKLQSLVAKHCYPDLDTTLGRSAKMRAKSAYSFAWYMPSQAQRDGGALWIRCDVILMGGQTIRPLPTDATPFLPTPLDDTVARCLVGRAHLPTVCNRSHNYRASAATLVKGSTYPGDKTLYKIAAHRCPNLVSTPASWYATWPTKISWRAGRRLITCYSKVSN